MRPSGRCTSSPGCAWAVARRGLLVVAPLANRAAAAVPAVREGVLGQPGNVEVEQVAIALDEEVVGAGGSDFTLSVISGVVAV